MDLERARAVKRLLAVATGAAALAVALAALVALTVGAPARAALEWSPDTLSSFDGTLHHVELGYLTVPVDRAKPKGPTLRLGFLRLGATGGAKGTPIVFIAGGAGIPSSYLTRFPAYGRFFERLRASGDVILVDQRGLGFSNPPLTCSSSEPLPGDVFVSEARAKEVFDAAFAVCANGLRSAGFDPGLCDPRIAADDVEEILRSIGADHARLIAFSNGTDIALNLLRRPNAKFDRAVLVAPRGLDEAWRLPGVFDAQVQRFGAAVAHDSLYGKRLPDLSAAIRAAVKDLNDHPRRITVVNRVNGASIDLTAGGFALQMVLQSDLGDPLGISMVPALLTSIQDHDDTLFGAKLGNLYNNLTTFLNLELVASDCASGADAARRAEIAREAEGSVLGGSRVLFQRPALCDTIGVRDLGNDYRSPVKSDVPTLFLSGSVDANAPPLQAEKLRQGFRNGVHVTVTNGWHDMLPVPDVQSVVLDFLDGKDIAGRPLLAPSIRLFSLEKAKAALGVGRAGDPAPGGPPSRKP